MCVYIYNLKILLKNVERRYGALVPLPNGTWQGNSFSHEIWSIIYTWQDITKGKEKYQTLQWNCMYDIKTVPTSSSYGTRVFNNMGQEYLTIQETTTMTIKYYGVSLTQYVYHLQKLQPRHFPFDP